MGLGGYCRRFIKDFARPAEPLQRLIPDCASFQWDAGQEEAFNVIKDALIRVTQMAHPQSGQTFIMDCGAFTAGRGAALSRKIVSDGRGRLRSLGECLDQTGGPPELEAFPVVRP